MEVLINLIKEANRLYVIADHLTYITYPTVKDNKLLIKILENLYGSLSKAMEAVLYYDRMYKRISPLAEGFMARLSVFKEKCAPRYDFDRDFIVLINDLRTITNYRKKSPMEFSRGDKFVICSDDYKLKTITQEKVKDYLARTKISIGTLNSIFKNDRRFRE
jgi:hypothetical protein|tara:strand:+ start:55422 stop:55907 length:486 start_codon:yes stop_codon:yes gene_type:complete